MIVTAYGQIVTSKEVVLKNGDTRCYGMLLSDGKLYSVESLNNKQLPVTSEPFEMTLDVNWGAGANGKWFRAIVL